MPRGAAWDRGSARHLGDVTVQPSRAEIHAAAGGESRYREGDEHAEPILHGAPHPKSNAWWLDLRHLAKIGRILRDAQAGEGQGTH